MTATDFLQACERTGIGTPEAMNGIAIIGTSGLLNATVDRHWQMACGRDCRDEEAGHGVFKLVPVSAAVPGPPA